MWPRYGRESNLWKSDLIIYVGKRLLVAATALWLDNSNVVVHGLL